MLVFEDSFRWLHSICAAVGRRHLMVGAPELLAQTKAELARYFTITDGGPAKQYRGMILRSSRSRPDRRYSNANQPLALRKL